MNPIGQGDLLIGGVKWERVGKSRKIKPINRSHLPEAALDSTAWHAQVAGGLSAIAKLLVIFLASTERKLRPVKFLPLIRAVSDCFLRSWRSCYSAEQNFRDSSDCKYCGANAIILLIYSLTSVADDVATYVK